MRLGPLLFLARLLFLAGLYGLVFVVARLVWEGMPAGEAGAARSILLSLREAVGEVAVNGAPWPVGEKMLLPLPVTFGRQSGNTVRIEDPFVSACHAELSSDGAAVWLFDRGSKNGTWIGEGRLDRPARLRTGEEFRLGGTRFRFEE